MTPTALASPECCGTRFDVVLVKRLAHGNRVSRMCEVEIVQDTLIWMTYRPGIILVNGLSECLEPQTIA